MDINNIPINRINEIELEKVSQTPKAKDTEFQAEKGRDLLGMQGDSRHVLYKGKNALSFKANNSKSPQEFESYLKTLTVKDRYGDDTPRFYRLDIQKIIECYKQYPDIVEKLVDIKIKNSDTPRFGRDGIINLAEMYAKYPEIVKKGLELTITDTNGNEVPLLAPIAFKEITETYEKYPEIFEELSAIKEKDANNNEIARFNMLDVARLVKSYTQYPKAVKDLINIRTPNSDVPRFSRSGIIDLAETYAQYPEEVKKLSVFTQKDSNGNNVPRLWGFEIAKLVESYIKYPQAVEKLLILTEKYSNLDLTYCYRGHEIKSLLKTYIKSPEFVEKLLGATVKKTNGNEVPRFYMYEIIELTEAYNKYPQIIQKALSLKDSNNDPIYNLDKIKILIKNYNKYSDAAEYLSTITQKDSNGNDVKRFDEFDIACVVDTFRQYPDVVKALSALTKNDSNGNKVPRFDAEDINDLAEAYNEYPTAVTQLANMTRKDSNGYEVPRFDTEDINDLAKEDICKTANLEMLNQFFDKAEVIQNRMKEKPDLYLNGEETDTTKINRIIKKFCFNHLESIYKLLDTFDKEVVDLLMRKRLEEFGEYLDVLNNIEPENLKLLKELSNSWNIDGKPFMPTQKAEFIDLFEAYKVNGLSFDKIKTMVETGKVNLGELHLDLFNRIMKNSGLTDTEIASIPKEKLVAWDTKYAHLLSKEIATEKDIAFSDILRAGNLEPDFNEYIHDTNNEYGQANAKTRTIYESMNMQYDRWLNPDKKHEIHFVSKDKNTEQLSQIASQITEDMNTLMQTPVKGFLKKQFPKCINENKFVIPNEYLTSKTKLTEFVKTLSDTSDQGQMAQVWKRAQDNMSNPDPKRVQSAQNTLTILDHLNQRLDDISQVSDVKVSKNIDLTIKMWDRNPQKDIFQGNYSTCCIAMGGGNGSAMPHFIMNTAYNMIELVDNKNGKTIGNALCYFIKGEDGKPAFIIDNIEIANNAKPSDEVGIEIRNAMAEYAALISKDVTGEEYTPVYMSKSYNDVPWNDLSSKKETISFLGEIDCDDIYMDLYGGWVDSDNLNQKLTFYQLK